MNSVISFIIVLGLLIFVHEFGHFLLAKIFKVKILKFSLGFGPRVIGKKYGDTEYLVSAFPLGGYVKMLGENPGDEVRPADEQKSFSAKPVWQRFLIVAAGPIFNLLFAVLLFFLIFNLAGIPEPLEGTEIGAVTPGSPAEEAGLLAGDVILAIDGQTTLRWEDVSQSIRGSAGRQVRITVKRDKNTLEFTGRPVKQKTTNIFGEVVGERFLLGISRTPEMVYKKASFRKALLASLSQTWGFIYLTIMGIVKIIQKVVPASELGGPILIAQMAGRQMQAGWINLVYFMGLLSVNLGVLNLFPVPILDGGHLVFFSVEAITRKPLTMKTQEMWQQVGLVLLIALMVFVFYNDLARLFG